MTAARVRCREWASVLLAFSVLLVGAARSDAQEMSIDELVAVALERSPDIREARQAIAAAEGERTQAALRANPGVMGDWEEQANGPDRAWQVQLEVPLELGRRAARAAAAQRRVELTTVQVEDRERVLAAAIREQAGRLLAARRMLAVVDEALASARQMREQLERRASEGAIPQIEANLATLEMWRVEAERTGAVAEADVAMVELKAMAGLPPDAPLSIRESLEALVRGAAPPPEVTADAVATRTDIRAALADVTFADARIEEARREAGVDVNLFGGYGSMRFSFMQMGFDERGNHVPIEMSAQNIMVGANVMLPLWNRNQGMVAAARAERLAAAERLTGRQLAARAELDAAVVRDREARRAVDLYGASIRPLAQRDADIILEAYELGRIRLIDLLDNQRRYLEIERDYTEALSRAYDARVALRRARGEIR